MQTIQSSHKAMPLIGVSSGEQSALTERILRGNLIGILVSAFLIVATVAFFLNLASQILTKEIEISQASQIGPEEETAFIPGRFISERLEQNYLKRY